MKIFIRSGGNNMKTIAIIGCGRIAKNAHFPALDIIEDVRIKYACDLIEEKAQFMKDTYDFVEEVIVDFSNHESDILICTTIIENGIDLPKANPLIVIDADKLGLSTLYQLKGRVGRSDRLAYAYFTFKREKILINENFFTQLKRKDRMINLCPT